MGVRKKIITELSETEKIIAATEVCHLAMVDQEGKPYCIPMNFGYDDGCFYFHTGPGGKKLDILAHNPYVCISMEIDSQLFVRQEEVACSYSMLYKSVVASGKAEFIEDADEKRKLMNVIMKQYTQRDDYKYNDPAINNVVILKVKCTEIIAHDRAMM